MELTESQKDALTELINIAFSRTAASLSELTGNRVELAVPEVAVCPIADLAAELARFVSGDVATVHQVFDGPVAGDAFLLLNYEAAVNLVKMLTGVQGTIERFGASSKEVLSEVGNILLNACLGIFGDLLQIRFSFTVPRLHLESLSALLGSLVIGKAELHYALVVGARFHLQSNEVSGCLVIVLGIASLGHLMQAVENWAEAAVLPSPKPVAEA
jgi:chemotaxis protein CheC